jgi:hypothetical protein
VVRERAAKRGGGIGSDRARAPASRLSSTLGAGASMSPATAAAHPSSSAARNGSRAVTSSNMVTPSDHRSLPQPAAAGSTSISGLM